ncbi:STAS/SEC14 domain-containing protein [Halomonas stenophila]|uniref:Cob(I)alamin adenosyltransferase n=1 Tax=Halomonas stenophila TaxID=795312 RepID=A0A7W5HJF9_9GAMM|nr:STAS/SEC14 domain-containing protein [Halomonas stenophila]MBB3229406.1 cob(I)alamin adenosyltransferase [Halomonas stenophila]
MLELLPPGADHVVAMRVSGRVTAADLQPAIEAIEAVKKSHPRVSLYTELDEMRWMTFTAFLRDLGYALTQVGDLDRYYRAAVLSDKHWVRHLTRLENRLFKAMEIRTFPTREKSTALEWVRQLPEAPTTAMA